MYSEEKIMVPSKSKVVFAKGITIEHALIIRSNIANIFQKDFITGEDLKNLINLAVEKDIKDLKFMEPILNTVFKLLSNEELEENLQNIIANNVKYNGEYLLRNEYKVATVDDPIYMDLHFIYFAILRKCFAPLISGFNGILSQYQEKPQNPQE